LDLSGHSSANAHPVDRKPLCKAMDQGDVNRSAPNKIQPHPQTAQQRRRPRPDILDHVAKYGRDSFESHREGSRQDSIKLTSRLGQFGKIGQTTKALILCLLVPKYLQRNELEREMSFGTLSAKGFVPAQCAQQSWTLILEMKKVTSTKTKTSSLILAKLT